MDVKKHSSVASEAASFQHPSKQELQFVIDTLNTDTVAVTALLGGYSPPRRNCITDEFSWVICGDNWTQMFLRLKIGTIFLHLFCL